ncbi:MAG: type II toxin-antitoxin system VapC family toxin [Anaerolineae bacterium]|nr:type II toxin-antitoxin system VapC family toxin [Anaerolineae bacterium]
MKLLLDTQVFLWFISADDRLPERVRNIIRNPQNEVYLSVVSLWEAVVKYQLGKLPLPQPPQTYLPSQRQQHKIASLSLDELSVARLADLPLLHRDPFDRMLVCQALQHDLIIVTADETVEQYPVSILEM